MKANPNSVAKSFKATLERMPSNLGWVIIRIPFGVPKVWGTRGMLKVKGEINGFAFRTSLFPTGRGYHYLLVPFQLVPFQLFMTRLSAGRFRRVDRHPSFPILFALVGTALVRANPCKNTFPVFRVRSLD